MTAPAEPTIRLFRPGDRPHLVQLWSEVFPDDPPRNAPERMIEGALKVHPDLLFVADLDGAVVGAVIAGFDGVRGWIYHLAVAASHRRRGIGARLVRSAGEALRRAGCPKVNLQVRTDNREVVAFYRAIGFEVEERISMGRPLA
jgi:ribosomal protein S18 acetylase RimI-like enzyme